MMLINHKNPPTLIFLIKVGSGTMTTAGYLIQTLGNKASAEFCNVRHAATIGMRNDFSLGVTELRVLLSLQLFDDKSG